MKLLVKKIIQILLCYLILSSSVMLGQEGYYFFSLKSINDPDSTKIAQILYFDSQKQDTILIEEGFCSNETSLLDSIQLSQNPFQPNYSTAETLDETIWLNSDDEGAIPYEFCSNTNYNKLYVYGRGRKVVILDASSGEVIGHIPIATAGYISNFNYLRYFPYEKLMAYNDNADKFYCTTPTHTLKIFDGESDNYIAEINSGGPDYKYAFSYVLYESTNDKIFWGSGFGYTSSENRIKVIDGTSNNVEAEYNFPLHQNIDDMLINPNNPNIIYVSSYESIITLEYNYNNQTFTVLYNYDLPSDATPGLLSFNTYNNMLYVNEHGNNNLYVLNGSTGQLDHVVTIPFFAAFRSIYNSEYNKFYLTGLTSDGLLGYYTFDCNTEHSTEDIFNCNGILYNTDDDIVYVTNFVDKYPSEIFVKMFDGESNNLINSVINNGGGGSPAMFYNGSEEKLFVGNNDGGSITLYDKNLNEVGENPVNTISTNTVQGIYDNKSNKLFIPNFDTPNAYSSVTVISGNNNQVTNVIPTDKSIQNLALNTNNDNDKLFITHKRDAKVTMIDCNTEQPTSIACGQVPNKIISASNNYVFVGCHDQIDVIDATSGSITTTIDNIGGSVTDFDKFGSYIYALIKGDINRLIAINIKDFTLDYQVNLGEEPLHCKVFDDKIYITKLTNDGQFNTIIDIYDLTDNLNLLHSYSTTLFDPKIEVSDFSRNKYFMGKDNYLLGYYIQVLDANDDFANNIHITNGHLIDMKYNSNNHCLYVYWEDLTNIDLLHSLYVNKYNTLDNTYLSTIYLNQDDLHVGVAKPNGQNDFIGLDIKSYYKQMAFNENRNKLYILNGNMSNVNVIECAADVTTYDEGFNWISFPKLDRSGGNPSPDVVLDGMTPPPIFMTITGLPDQTPDWGALTRHRNENGQWSGGLEDIESQRGYILQLPDNPLGTSYTLEMTGTILDPSTPMTIYPFYSNWVGYFLPETQDPFDALSNVFPYLKSITGQYWSAANYGSMSKPNWIGTPPDQLKYGDMLKLRTFQQVSFTWHRDGDEGTARTYSDPEYYSYQEDIDYTPIFIEIDTSNRPLEIGAFAGDSCVGACTVSDTDTLVLVRGFLEGQGDDSLSFEQYFGNKSTQHQRTTDYYVFNTDLQKKEKRVIHLDEKKDFYLVSLRKPSESSIKDRIPELSFEVYPNPSSGDVFLEFYLPVDTELQLEVYDVYGKQVAIIEKGKMSLGNHQLQWHVADSNGQSLLPGLYFVKLKAGGANNTRKIIVN